MTEESLKKAQDLYGKILNLRREIEDIEKRKSATQHRCLVRISYQMYGKSWDSKEFEPKNLELLIENHVSDLKAKLKSLETELELLT